MSEQIKKQVFEMSVGLLIHNGALFLIALIWFRRLPVFLGILVGMLTAVGLLISMARSTELCVEAADEDFAKRKMTIHAVYNNMQVDNVVITYRDRPEGSESKLNTYSDGFRVLKTIFRMFRQYRPFAFFGLLALLLFVIAVGFFIPVGIEYVETGLVPKFPTLIACGFAGLAALQSLFAGLILHNLGVKDRRDFEFRLQIVGKDTKE